MFPLPGITRSTLRRWTPWLLIGAFTAAYTALSWQNVWTLNAGLDLAGYGQALFNLSHGRLPFNTFKGFVMWGDHAHFIITLLAPLYRLWPSVYLILLVQVLAVTLAGWPLYQLSLRYTRHIWFSLVLLYSYLAFIGIQFALDFDFHPSVLTGAALLWAMYGHVTKRPWLFWVSLALGLLTREDAPPIFFMLGVWLLIERAWRRGSIAIAFSAAYFLAVAYLIMPLWTPGGAALSYLDVDDTSPVSVVSGFVLYPDTILQNMFDTEQKRHTMHVLVQSFAYLPLLSPFTWLTAAPIFYSRFGSGEDYRWLIENHSNANVLPLLAIGALFGTVTLAGVLERKPIRWPRRGTYLVAALALVAAVQYTAWGHPAAPLAVWGASLKNEAAPETAAWQELRTLIPPDAAVSASSGFLPSLANRQALYNYPEVPEHTEWIVISAAGNPWPLSRSKARQEIKQLKEDSHWNLAAVQADIFIFRRR